MDVIEKRSCPACGASSIARELGHKSGFDLLRCAACQTLYTKSLPSTETAEDYDGYYSEANLSVASFIHQRLDEIVADFAAYKQGDKQQGGCLLDIGFGAGSLLQAAARAGWEATGIEVSRTAVEHIRRQGFQAFCGELSAAGFPSNHFDVVTASEVVEHVAEPKALIAEIARVLRPGGLLWATTPHGRGLSARALGLNWSVVSPPEHLQLFSPQGIRNLLTTAGFRHVTVATRGVNPFELLSAYKRSRTSHIATPSAENIAAPVASVAAVETNASHLPQFDRVATSCQINEMLSTGTFRRGLKNFANGLLRVTRMGDSLKILAQK